MNVCSLGWRPLSASVNGRKIARPPRVVNSVLIRCWGSTQSQKKSVESLLGLLAPGEVGNRGLPILPRNGEKTGGQRGPWGPARLALCRGGLETRPPGQRGASQTSGSKLDHLG